MSRRYAAPFLSGGSHVIDAALAESLLRISLEQGGDFSDLFFEYGAAASMSFEEGMLKSAGRSVGLGVGIRVQKGDATGYAYVEDLSITALEGAARTAAKIASAGKIATVALTPVSPPQRYPIADLSLDVDGEAKRTLLQRADAAARRVDARVVQVEVSLHEELREVLIASSDGVFVSDRQPLLRFGVRVVAEAGGKRESGSSGGGGRLGLEYFATHSPESHAEEAVRQALVLLEAREAPAGEMTVVLAPGDSGVLLHEAVGHGLEADFNRKKTSNYTDCIGQKVASELCTVIDDATLAFGRGTINIDDEGNVPTNTLLIDKGILRGYLQDRHSAAYFGAKRTGNGRRQGFQSPPLPRMTNTLLMAGDDDPDAILRSVKRGIYARKFGGGQVDISNGDFVFSLTESYLIEDGRITAPLKGVNLIGNGPEVMRRVEMLGNDLRVSDGIWTCGKDGQSVPVGVGCPTVKISSVTVGGTQLGG